ncbi:MAG TPA: Rieske (2Fe-2S) protein [Bacillales bacterium]|nr:Rieske (2Fe-2S) protein [Bacillales bacterium]
MENVVCKTSELQPGEMMEASLGRTPIVVCRTLDGDFYAFSNRCIHQGGPMSKGVLCGTSVPTDRPGEYCYGRKKEILRCPWHGREFDVKNDGRMLTDPRRKLPSFTVDIVGGNVIVSK